MQAFDVDEISLTSFGDSIIPSDNPMPDPVITPESIQRTDQFYTQVKSISQFDEAEINPTIVGLLKTTSEEDCFIGTYYRARCQVATILLLQNAKHFQAAASLARSLFELAVDLRLLEIIPNGWIKMLAFVDVEKLRCVRKVVKFAKSQPQPNADMSRHESFITSRAAEIDAKRQILWPNQSRIEHWSGKNMADRVKDIGDPFHEFYEAQYPMLSWSVHAGLTNVLNLKAETFVHLCGHAFKLSADSYCEVLRTMIRKFGLSKFNASIEKNLKIAQLLPFADTQDNIDGLTQAITRANYS